MKLKCRKCKMNFESINAVYEYAYVCRDASVYACTCLMNEFGEPFQTIINLFLSYMGDTLRFSRLIQTVSRKCLL